MRNCFCTPSILVLTFHLPGERLKFCYGEIRCHIQLQLGIEGGLLKRHVGATDGLCRPLILDDVCLNAKGYERLVGSSSLA